MNFMFLTSFTLSLRDLRFELLVDNSLLSRLGACKSLVEILLVGANLALLVVEILVEGQLGVRQRVWLVDGRGVEVGGTFVASVCKCVD